MITGVCGFVDEIRLTRQDGTLSIAVNENLAGVLNAAGVPPIVRQRRPLFDQGIVVVAITVGAGSRRCGSTW
jgi:hypothetical protein